MLDPLIKGVVRCTGIFFETENLLPSQAEGLGELPAYQESNSEKSVQVFSGIFCTVLILEAKKFTRDAVAQVVGYYIGTSKSHSGLHSLMAIVFCEDKCRAVIFPFQKGEDPCVDAVFSPEYHLFHGQEINMDIL